MDGEARQCCPELLAPKFEAGGNGKADQHCSGCGFEEEPKQSVHY
jgi:hypothetical protein